MPKIPKPKEITKIISTLGFVLIRQSGSHAIYENKTSKIQIVIPVRGSKEISIGVFKKILRDLELDINSFWKLK